eukprot:TRINITY_DN2545_c0_g1_i1.p1 TRINITY_DN2545_c0_g1~~TRINITY_DN2545_c0_g1_i1.p1  ORF type:complete len:1442 (+),score=343.13 TRINITY_DN2545_c0_g1_i1:84-4328(+)
MMQRLTSPEAVPQLGAAPFFGSGSAGSPRSRPSFMGYARQSRGSLRELTNVGPPTAMRRQGSIHRSGSRARGSIAISASPTSAASGWQAKAEGARGGRRRILDPEECGNTFTVFEAALEQLSAVQKPKQQTGRILLSARKRESLADAPHTLLADGTSGRASPLHERSPPQSLPQAAAAPSPPAAPVQLSVRTDAAHIPRQLSTDSVPQSPGSADVSPSASSRPSSVQPRRRSDLATLAREAAKREMRRRPSQQHPSVLGRDMSDVLSASGGSPAANTATGRLLALVQEAQNRENERKALHNALMQKKDDELAAMMRKEAHRSEVLRSKISEQEAKIDALKLEVAEAHKTIADAYKFRPNVMALGNLGGGLDDATEDTTEELRLAKKRILHLEEICTLQRKRLEADQNYQLYQRAINRHIADLGLVRRRLGDLREDCERLKSDIGGRFRVALPQMLASEIEEHLPHLRQAIEDAAAEPLLSSSVKPTSPLRSPVASSQRNVQSPQSVPQRTQRGSPGKQDKLESSPQAGPSPSKQLPQRRGLGGRQGSEPPTTQINAQVHQSGGGSQPGQLSPTSEPRQESAVFPTAAGQKPLQGNTSELEKALMLANDQLAELRKHMGLRPGRGQRAQPAGHAMWKGIADKGMPLPPLRMADVSSAGAVADLLQRLVAMARTIADQAVEHAAALTGDTLAAAAGAGGGGGAEPAGGADRAAAQQAVAEATEPLHAEIRDLQMKVDAQGREMQLLQSRAERGATDTQRAKELTKLAADLGRQLQSAKADNEELAAELDELESKLAAGGSAAGGGQRAAPAGADARRRAPRGGRPRLADQKAGSSSVTSLVGRQQSSGGVSPLLSEPGRGHRARRGRRSRARGGSLHSPAGFSATPSASDWGDGSSDATGAGGTVHTGGRSRAESAVRSKRGPRRRSHRSKAAGGSEAGGDDEDTEGDSYSEECSGEGAEERLPRSRSARPRPKRRVQRRRKVRRKVLRRRSVARAGEHPNGSGSEHSGEEVEEVEEEEEVEEWEEETDEDYSEGEQSDEYSEDGHHAAAKGAGAPRGSERPRIRQKPPRIGSGHPAKVYCYLCGSGPFRALGCCPSCDQQLYYGVAVGAGRRLALLDALRKQWDRWMEDTRMHAELRAAQVHTGQPQWRVLAPSVPPLADTSGPEATAAFAAAADSSSDGNDTDRADITHLFARSSAGGTHSASKRWGAGTSGLAASHSHAPRPPPGHTGMSLSPTAGSGPAPRRPRDNPLLLPADLAGQPPAAQTLGGQVWRSFPPTPHQPGPQAVRRDRSGARSHQSSTAAQRSWAATTRLSPRNRSPPPLPPQPPLQHVPRMNADQNDMCPSRTLLPSELVFAEFLERKRRQRRHEKCAQEQRPEGVGSLGGRADASLTADSGQSGSHRSDRHVELPPISNR